MAEPKAGGVKTLAIRLTDELHAQLVLIAQLDGLTLTDTIRQAIEGHIERKRAGGDLAARAEQALADIDRETAARRAAIEALLSQAPPAAAQPTSRPSRRRQG
jgi:predicted DNA-binding protein